MIKNPLTRIVDPDPHYFGSWIRIRIEALAGALQPQSIESLRAVDAHKGGVEAQNEAPGRSSVDLWSQIRINLMSSRV